MDWNSLDEYSDAYWGSADFDSATCTANPDEACCAEKLDYVEWLSRGKQLAAEHNGRNWLIGDWLNEGDDAYNFRNLGIPSHLLIGSHPPNFWKDVSDQVDLAVGTLKNLSLVARRYRPDKRFSELSWSHHACCASYERRFEYLAACIVPSERPHTLEWLAAFIEQHEGDPEARERRSIPLRLPRSVIEKIKDIAKHEGKTIEAIVHNICAFHIHEFLQQQERELALEIYGMYDEGAPWPLSTSGKIHYAKYDKKKGRPKKI